MTAPELKLDTVTLERDGHVLAIGLNRPDKRNAFNLAMLADLSRVYALLESDDSLRAGVLFAHGDHFTAGLDLVDVGPNIVSGEMPFPDNGQDSRRRSRHPVLADGGEARNLPVRRSHHPTAAAVGADAAEAQAAARAIAHTIADRRPSRGASGAGLGTADAAEDVQSFIERREARFGGS
jgi:hypothetical protein